MTLQVALASILLSSTIALVAYFYREWKLKLESYIQQLCQIIWLLKNNEHILELMLSREVNIRGTRTKLELLPAFGLTCLPWLDNVFRYIIFSSNARIIAVKEASELLEIELQWSLKLLSGNEKIIERILDFIVSSLYNNVLWYYVFKYQVRRLDKEKSIELNPVKHEPPKDEQPQRNDTV